MPTYHIFLIFLGNEHIGDIFLHKENFLESVILFLKYIKYKYLYTSIPILFARTNNEIFPYMYEFTLQ